jgi:hypothetical protein
MNGTKAGELTLTDLLLDGLPLDTERQPPLSLVAIQAASTGTGEAMVMREQRRGRCDGDARGSKAAVSKWKNDR